MLSVVGGLKTKSGVSSESGGDTLEGTLCLEIIRLKLRATNKILLSMFFSHGLILGAIPR